jgi:hypothetical protein
MRDQPAESKRTLKAGGLFVVGLFLLGLIMTAFGHGPQAAPEVDGPGPKHSVTDGHSHAGGSEAATAHTHEEEPRLPEARGATSAAGEPRAVAREFALAWINRPTDRAGIRAANQRLIALSRGPWADQVGASLTANRGSGSRGTVVGVQEVMRRGGSAVELVTTREQLAPHGDPLEPYHYGLYLARLERAPRGFAVSSWEPQF